MPITWTSARRVAAGISLAITVLAGMSFVSAWSAWRDFRTAERAEPAGGPIDLSAHHPSTLPLAHTYPAAHGVELNVEFPSGQSAELALAGLAARLEVLPEARSAPLLTLDYAGGYNPDPARPEVGRLFYINGLPRGNYLLRLTVEQSPPALPDSVQTLRGDYLLCGLEALPALLLAALGIACLFVALLISGLTFRFSRPPTTRAAALA